MKHVIKWYLILASIWAIFWIINTFFLIPLEDTPAKTLEAFWGEDGYFLFALTWSFVTAPFQLLLVLIFAQKIVSRTQKWITGKFGDLKKENG